MKSLQKTRELSEGTNCGCLIRRFHEDEERENMKNLLFGDIRLSRSKNIKDV